VNRVGVISSLILIFSGAAAVFAAAPETYEKKSARKSHLISIAQIPPEEAADRCISFTYAIAAYRQIMRSNPVYGKNGTADAELTWGDELLTEIQNAGADIGSGTLRFVDDYMDTFGPVTVPSSIAQLDIVKADKEYCQKRYGSGS